MDVYSNRRAASKDMRERFRKARRAFIAMFEEAALKLKFGDLTGARFPKGSFLPGLPFVRTGEKFEPLADAGGSRAFADLVAVRMERPVRSIIGAQVREPDFVE